MVLIGTIVVIVFSSLIIEMFNISTTGMQINQTSKMAAKQACDLFAQESYKTYAHAGASGGSVNPADINDVDGKIYVSGQFYPTVSSYATPADAAKAIYNSLYNNPSNTDFKVWLAGNTGNWYNLDRINQGINGNTSVAFGQTGYNDAMTAKLYINAMMTPVNLGIPYLDSTTLNKMFKWNLAQLLSNCNSKSIEVDNYGKSYVAFRGFRIYADEASITTTYKICDLRDPIQKADFENITNLNPDKLVGDTSKPLQYDTGLTSIMSVNQITNDKFKICLVGISYTVPITYEGITPIKTLFNYVWNTEVAGLNGGGGRTKNLQWNDSTSNLQSGGFYGNTAPGVLPVPGQLVYYIIQ